MWTLVLIYALHSGGISQGYAAAAIDHVDGFHSEQACIVAANKIQQVNTKIESGVHAFCVRKQ
jgi:hypothetical protein